MWQNLTSSIFHRNDVKYYSLRINDVIYFSKVMTSNDFDLEANSENRRGGRTHTLDSCFTSLQSWVKSIKMADLS